MLANGQVRINPCVSLMLEVHVNAIHVLFDEIVLKRLDRQRVVRERGRSAVLREAASDFLKRMEAEEIDRRYAAG